MVPSVTMNRFSAIPGANGLVVPVSSPCVLIVVHTNSPPLPDVIEKSKLVSPVACACESPIGVGKAMPDGLVAPLYVFSPFHVPTPKSPGGPLACGQGNT